MMGEDVRKLKKMGIKKWVNLGQMMSDVNFDF